ncbi:unnamed protein product [Penicillium salamii]|nr:unnamed protein product [Penicillium salamii]
MQGNSSSDPESVSKLLVALPNGHRLSVVIAGPQRQADVPITIIIPGVACSMTEWAGVQRLLSPNTSVLLYERSGLGASDESEASPTASDIACELDVLLQTLAIAPPYVLVCHSYGGIIAREFVDLRQRTGGDDVVGMVCVDANQEDSIRLWPDSDLSDLAKGLDWYTAIGLEEENVLSEAEWQAVRDEQRSEKHQRTTQKEMEHYVASCKKLGAKKQLERRPPLLGNYPVSVIRGHPERDLRRVLQIAETVGNGTEEQRRQFGERLDLYPTIHESIQKEILKLSLRHRFLDVPECGHFIHLMKPEIVVEEVRWVLQLQRN